jgi:hypothetical protein
MYQILLLYNLILYVDDNALVKDSRILLSPFLCEELPLAYKIPGSSLQRHGISNDESPWIPEKCYVFHSKEDYVTIMFCHHHDAFHLEKKIRKTHKGIVVYNNYIVTILYVYFLRKIKLK